MLKLLLFCFVITVHSKPNFVVILTDDQDSVLEGMTPMQNVRKLIGNQGVTFTSSYTTSPICCPSRASLLTGQYVHNHRTFNNSLAGNCYGRRWRTRRENATFPYLLHKEGGYRTFYAGKYLNEYGSKRAGGPELVPPGWSEWHGLVGNSVYYNYTISNDGVPTHSTDLYLTDVIRDLSLSFIENQTESQPFFMMLSPPAPHQPFTPAPRHAGVYHNVTALKNPSFNIAVDDKHWLLTMPPSPLPDIMLPELDKVFRSRWESLLAVDEMVADVIEALDTFSLLDNTYIIYTSDNGYHVGQFSQVFDKRQPYETDIKVPLLIRGPWLSKNVKNRQSVLNIDLAPTILQLAGLKVPDSMDGHPIELDEMAAIAERSMLIEYHGESRDGTVDSMCPWIYDRSNLAQCSRNYACKCQDAKNNTYACIRHRAPNIDRKYCLFVDEESYNEVYDLSSDPHELHNSVNDIFPAVKHWYHLTLAQMTGCKGAKECDNPVSSDSANVVLKK